MLRNNKGFTLIEVLVASSILFLVMMTVVPINSLLTNERIISKDRYEYADQLQAELQPFIWERNKRLPATYERTINNQSVSFQITRETDVLIKGCVRWINAREKQEEVCLYGYPEK